MAKTDKTNVEAAQWNKNFQQHNQELVLLEAMACGIPCVSFNCDYGPREIIVDKVTGILVEDGNVEKLAQEILWMVEHHKERLEMGNNACEAIKKYRVDTIMQKWTILFDELFQTTN
jgi:glycosyltransferase involved in cell wall biosynthesis